MQRLFLALFLFFISFSFASISMIKEKRGINNEAVALEIKLQGIIRYEKKDIIFY